MNEFNLIKFVPQFLEMAFLKYNLLPFWTHMFTFNHVQRKTDIQKIITKYCDDIFKQEKQQVDLIVLVSNCKWWRTFVVPVLPKLYIKVPSKESYTLGRGEESVPINYFQVCKCYFHLALLMLSLRMTFNRGNSCL